jgi:Aldo/keto reductases, related to diketogulonate reductase
VLEVAKKHGKSPAQILLRHIVQRGIAAIPKSTNPERIHQNLQVRFNILSYIPVFQCILNGFLIPSAFCLHSGYSSSQRPTDQSV